MLLEPVVRRGPFVDGLRDGPVENRVTIGRRSRHL